MPAGSPYSGRMVSLFSLHHLIQLLHAYGNVVLGVVVGLESLGLPLPGETLLIAAAVLAGDYAQIEHRVRRSVGGAGRDRRPDGRLRDRLGRRLSPAATLWTLLSA